MSCEQQDEDKYIVEYDISEIGKVLSEIREIESAFDNLKNQFYIIETAIKNCRL